MTVYYCLSTVLREGLDCCVDDVVELSISEAGRRKLGVDACGPCSPIQRITAVIASVQKVEQQCANPGYKYKLLYNSKILRDASDPLTASDICNVRCVSSQFAREKHC